MAYLANFPLSENHLANSQPQAHIWRTEFACLTLDSLADLVKVAAIIRAQKVAIVSVSKLDRPMAARAIDWLSGYVCSFKGVVRWLGEDTFLFASQPIQITGNQPLESPLQSSLKTHLTKLFVELQAQILLEMVSIPSGSFSMGSEPEDINSSVDELPLHTVTVSDFYLSAYPITQAQWRAIASLPAVTLPLPLAPSYFTGDDLPVEQISWYEAEEFCARLSQKTGHIYRLPSEAEWEYACRAGTRTKFWFGEQISQDLANYDARLETDSQTAGLFLEKTTPVHCFHLKNPFGLADLHGNVWEWCADHWHENYQGAPENSQAWLSENPEQLRIIRGGSWYDLPRFCRSASRYALSPKRRVNDVGFRVACNPIN